MRQLLHIHLLRQVTPQRLLERRVGRQRPARQRPTARERLARPLPQERLQLPLPHLEDNREDCMGCSVRLRVVDHEELGTEVIDCEAKTSDRPAHRRSWGWSSYCLRYGLPSAAGGIERPMIPATAISVSTYGSASNST